MYGKEYIEYLAQKPETEKTLSPSLSYALFKAFEAAPNWFTDQDSIKFLETLKDHGYYLITLDAEDEMDVSKEVHQERRCRLDRALEIDEVIVGKIIKRAPSHLIYSGDVYLGQWFIARLKEHGHVISTDPDLV